jgi:hypothetical protein
MIKWNVIIEDANRRKITTYNIFDHHYFTEDCIQIAKESVSKDEFAEQIKRSARYFFGSKCEWEVIVSEFPPGSRIPELKIDVYYQLQLNFEQFIDYLWNNREELAKWSIT